LSFILVSANINIGKLPNEKYFLGDEIDFNVDVRLDSAQQVIFDSHLSCPNISTSYYRVLLNLKSNERKIIAMPSIFVDERFLGVCRFKFTIEDLKENIIEKTYLDPLNITNVFLLDFSVDREVYSPGGIVIIKLNLDYEREYNLNILLKDDNLTFNLIEETIYQNFYSGSIDLESDISRGKKSIVVRVTDKYGNKAEGIEEIEILQVPSFLEFNLLNEEVKPRDRLSFEAYLFDQSREKIYSNLTFRITNPQDKVIVSFQNYSGDSIFYDVPEYSIPGEYIVSVIFDDFEEMGKFVILKVREILVTVDNETIAVDNIGNIRYIDSIAVNATSSDGIVYVVPYEVDLRPGESGKIMVSDDLPLGVYTIDVPNGNDTFVFQYINEDDNRGFIKKISQGVSKITGSSIIDTESVSNFYLLGFLFVFLGFIMVFLVMRRFKGRVMGVIDDTVKVQGKKIGGLRTSLSKNKIERNKLREIFGRYVDSNVLKDQKVGVHKKDISVLFTDIRGFAKLFDTKDSSEVTDVLNMYFRKSNEIVKLHSGFINKFIGDSVMALFNAPSDDPEHIMKSIKSGLAIKREIGILNVRLKKKGMKPIEVGVGIDSGFCSVGSIGSKEKLEYTAIGVPVNTAFRLQGMSDGKVLITDRVYEKVKEKVDVELVGKFNLKNITVPVNVYSVVGVK